MPETCTITGNTIACITASDWDWAWPAAVGIMAAVLATWIANRHQRLEASKQRQLAAGADIVHSAYHMVRSSHHSEVEFRAHSSALEIAIRTFAADVPSEHRPFVAELMEWMRRLKMDCDGVGVRHESGDHETDDIKEIRQRNHLFVNYLTDWQASGERHRHAWVREMRTQRAILWPDMVKDLRVWP